MLGMSGHHTPLLSTDSIAAIVLSDIVAIFQELTLS